MKRSIRHGIFGLLVAALLFTTVACSSASTSANRTDRVVLAGDSGTVSVFAMGMTNPGGVVFNP